jgi:hypothetical protein
LVRGSHDAEQAAAGGEAGCPVAIGLDSPLHDRTHGHA